MPRTITPAQLAAKYALPVDAITRALQLREEARRRALLEQDLCGAVKAQGVGHDDGKRKSFERFVGVRK